MVAQIAGCTQEEAARALAQGDGSVKTAVVILHGLDRAGAEALLNRSGGNLRTALESLSAGALGGQETHSPFRHERLGSSSAVNPSMSISEERSSSRCG
jgi:hypothetical protein